MKHLVCAFAILMVLPAMAAGGGNPPPGFVRVEGVIASIDVDAWRITVGDTVVRISEDTILRMRGRTITFDDFAVEQTVAACGVEDEGLLIAHRVTVKYGGTIAGEKVVAGRGSCGSGGGNPPPGFVRIEGVIASIDADAWQITAGDTAVQITEDTILWMRGQPLTFDDLVVGQTVATCGVEDEGLFIAYRVTIKYGGTIIGLVETDSAVRGIVVAVSPHTLLLGSVQGGSVVVHADIPYSQVDLSTLALDGIAVLHTQADSRGDLVAYFDEAAVKEIVAPPSATLTLTGEIKDGTPFDGSDTVQVRPHSGR